MEGNSPDPEPQLLDPAAHSGYLPVISQRHCPKHDGVCIADITRERAFAIAELVMSASRSAGSNRPTEAQTLFYIKIDKHYGSSDHVTYMQHGIPAVMFINLAGYMWYHLPRKTHPDKQDLPTPVQTRSRCRNGSVGRSGIRHRRMRWPRGFSAKTSAAASREWANRTPRGLGYMADATDAAALTAGYKEARVAVLHQGEVEKGVVSSASILWTDANSGKQKTAARFACRWIDQRVSTLLERSEGGLSTPGRTARRAGSGTRHDRGGT